MSRSGPNLAHHIVTTTYFETVSACIGDTRLWPMDRKPVSRAALADRARRVAKEREDIRSSANKDPPFAAPPAPPATPDLHAPRTRGAGTDLTRPRTPLARSRRSLFQDPVPPGSEDETLKKRSLDELHPKDGDSGSKEKDPAKSIANPGAKGDVTDVDHKDIPVVISSAGGTAAVENADGEDAPKTVKGVCLCVSFLDVPHLGFMSVCRKHEVFPVRASSYSYNSCKYRLQYDFCFYCAATFGNP